MFHPQMDRTAPAGAARIHTAFVASRLDGRRAALMPFFMGGFPSLNACRAIGEAYVDAGADIVELGIPCHDPLSDGPVIRAAGTAALRGGTTVDDVLAVARAVSARVPVVIMCYAHLVLGDRAKPFADGLGEAGVSGLLVPDLTREQTPPVLEACDAAGVALVPIVAPAASDESVAALGARARGFVYTVSAHGTTGERPALRPDVASLVDRAKANSPVPVALGFGISTPDHAAQAADAGADGVIVGSRLVRAAAAAADPATAVRDVVGAFSAALRRPAAGM